MFEPVTVGAQEDTFTNFRGYLFSRSFCEYLSESVSFFFKHMVKIIHIRMEFTTARHAAPTHQGYDCLFH